MVLKQILLLVVLHACVLFSYGQLPGAKSQQDEMKQMIAELKKEIATLELEIKRAEKNDPEAVTSLKTQLNTYKSMLTAFDKPTVGTMKAPNTSQKRILEQTPLPIIKVHLKQPVVAPTAAQVKDHLFWFKGKKINDSTLVTTKRTVVQYSRKRQMLIVEPDEKKDSFVSVSKEIARSEQRKRELTDQFDKTKNGFIYYPYLVNTLDTYDDLTKRFSKAVNNTYSFSEPLPNVATTKSNNNKQLLSGNGPYSLESVMFEEGELTEESVSDIEKMVREQLDDAERKIKQLPSIENFPAPPRREVGRCANCDVEAIKRKYRLDSIWIQQYLGKEREIVAQIFSAGHTHGVLVGGEADAIIQERVISMALSLLHRLSQKNRILFERYGDEIHYLEVVLQVILGHDRQLQLLGVSDNAGSEGIGALAARSFVVYKKYYDEQVAAKNHDFVLNVPFHLGMYRQLALLGADEKANSVTEYFNEMMAYNHFALTMEMDFVWQQDADGELQRRATGMMETSKKIYVSLFPDNCGYRIMAHASDLNNKQFEDITLPMKVKGGLKTVREEDDKLKHYPYSGAPEYAFRFPDSKIDFCDNGPDTLFLAIIGGNDEVAARGGQDIQNISKAYTIDMLMYAGQVLINENSDELVEETLDAGNQILNTIGGFMQQAAPENTLDKMKIQYTGYMEMDNQRKLLENAYSTKTARIIFNANNRSTVLTDTYLDTKRKMENEVEIKKGLFHLRMVHEPLK